MQLIEDLDLFAKLLASIKVSGRTRPLYPFEVAKLIQRMQSEGLKTQEISDRLSIKKEMTNQFLSLNKIPKEYQNAIIWGASTDIGVSFSTAVRVARLDKPEDMSILLGSTMEHKFSKKEIENIVTLRRSGTVSITECIKKIKNIQPVIEYKHMYVITVNPDTITRLRNLSKLKNLESHIYLKNILVSHLVEKNILAIVIKGLKIVISLNADGAKIFSEILNKNKLTIGDSINYFLREA